MKLHIQVKALGFEEVQAEADLEPDINDNIDMYRLNDFINTDITAVKHVVRKAARIIPVIEYRSFHAMSKLELKISESEYIRIQSYLAHEMQQQMDDMFKKVLAGGEL